MNGKTGTVLNVYTEPKYRHHGYAKELMKIDHIAMYVNDLEKARKLLAVQEPLAMDIMRFVL